MPVVKKQDGFTLIEIIVSMILVPILWLAIGAPLSVNTMLISQAKHKAQAVFVAGQNLDIMRANGYAGLVAAAGTGKNVTIDTRGTTDTGDDLLGTMDIVLGSPVNENGGHYRQVTVTIKWNENSNGTLISQKTESLATIISDDPAVT